MKNYVIQSGNFTEKGNFTGYTALGVRVHIHKNQMDSKKWTKDAMPTFPFYAVGEIKQIGQLDENGKPRVDANNQAILVDRLTATSVFTSKDALVAALVDERTLDITVASKIATEAKSAGLSEESLKELLVGAV